MKGRDFGWNGPFRPASRLPLEAMTKHRRGSHPASELVKPQAETAEARLLFAMLGDDLRRLQSAAVFFAGDGALAIALAERSPGLRVIGFELRERAVSGARRLALDAGIGERTVFARLDPRIGAYGHHGLVVVRYPISEVADGEGALRAAAQASDLLAVFEHQAFARRVARIALQLGLVARTGAEASERGPVLQVFESPVDKPASRDNTA